MGEQKRFALLNFWWNIGDTTVVRAPLAILSVRYDKSMAFPNVFPNMNVSKWYVFPNICKDEVIVFYQYDCMLSQSSDLWHYAVTAKNWKMASQDYHQLSPWKSFDIQALIIFEESAPLERYRFAPNITSQCFCLRKVDAFVMNRWQKEIINDDIINYCPHWHLFGFYYIYHDFFNSFYGNSFLVSVLI